MAELLTHEMERDVRLSSDEDTFASLILGQMDSELYSWLSRCPKKTLLSVATGEYPKEYPGYGLWKHYCSADEAVRILTMHTKKYAKSIAKDVLNERELEEKQTTS